MQLSGLQREWVIQALLDAFPGYADFKYMIAIQLGENIEALVPLGSSLRNCVFELVVKMDARGQIAELLDAALRENPRNPQLLECQMKLGFGRQRGGDEISARPSDGGLPQRGRGPSTIPPHMLDHALSNKFVDLLMRIPLTETYSGRSSLLQGLPPVSLQRSEGNRRLDLAQIIQQIDQLGRLRTNGIRPLLVVASNGLASIQSWDGELTDSFEEIMRELGDLYGGEFSPPLDQEPQLEKLLFRTPIGSVGQDFFERAICVARGVARLMLPCVLHGVTVSHTYGFGTGWLIAPGLLLTNHHVVEVRESDVEPATYEDKCAQVKDILIWFDFFEEQRRPSVECRGAELVAFSKPLDYAVLRLKEGQRIADRKPLSIMTIKPTLKAGDHLNIVQHPQGGPLRYAIRNNYYVQTHPSREYMLHYLTDTESGSSGSPVLNDAWQVLALHHAAAPVEPREYDMRIQGRSQQETVNYFNEGITLYRILEDLPESVKREIQSAQQTCGVFL